MLSDDNLVFYTFFIDCFVLNTKKWVGVKPGSSGEGSKTKTKPKTNTKVAVPIMWRKLVTRTFDIAPRLGWYHPPVKPVKSKVAPAKCGLKTCTPCQTRKITI